jgi:hypothetical protein
MVVSLSDLCHLAASDPLLRPRLTADRVVTVPVRVALYRPGAARPFAVVYAEAVSAAHYRPAVYDEDGKVVAGERPAAVTLRCVLADGGA